jgi:hypothetical protein
VDEKELGLLVQKLLPGGHVDAGDLAALMRRLDADGGGTVDLQEFRAFCGAAPPRAQR